VLAAAGCGDDDEAGAPPPAPPATTAAPASPLTSERLVPADTSLFLPTYYPDVEPLPPAAGPEWSEQRALERAVELVEARDPALEAEARALFTGEELVAVAPDPVVRAALVSLLGTIAEPAVDWVAGAGPFTSVELGDPGGGVVARSLAEPDGTQRIVLDERLRFEDPGLLSAVLAHEALHSDGEVSDLEELVALSFQALVQMEQLLADPGLGDERTLLAQQLNPWVLARLNTREPGSTALRLVLADGAPTIFPGGIDRPYFAALFDPSAEPTPGNPLLVDLVAAVAEPDAPTLYPLDFSVETVELLDSAQSALTPKELARAAEALGLEPAGAGA
jgi:hypothetical protein